MTYASAVTETAPFGGDLLRLNMVEGQLRAAGVRDEGVLTAMQAIPREIFVAPNQATTAYRDTDILTAAPGRYLLAPALLARLLQAAEITMTDIVLDLAPASGYSSAIMGALARSVVAVEADADLSAIAKKNMAQIETQNVQWEIGPPEQGWRGPVQYDAIVIEGAVGHVPPGLFDQMAEGGRLVCVFQPRTPSGDLAPIGQVRLYKKIKSYVSHLVLFEASAKPLLSFYPPAGFVF